MPDPDREIKRGGGGSPIFFFQLFRPQFGVKIRGGEGLRPLPWIHHWGGFLWWSHLGLEAIKRAGGGNIDTSSTWVCSREKEYESEITLVVDEQIPFLQHCPLRMSVKSFRRTVFKLTQTFGPANVIQIVLVTIVRVVLIQRGTVLWISSDDFFLVFYSAAWFKKGILGYSKQS